MRAALGGRNSVAIGIDEAVVAIPGNGPFHRAMAAALAGGAGEGLDRHLVLLADRGFEIVLEAAGEMERRDLRRLVLLAHHFRRAFPADLDAAEKIGLGARHLEQPRRIEGAALAEDRLVGLEAHLGAAPVVDFAHRFERAKRHALPEFLPVKLAVARDLDFKMDRKRVDDRNADAVQAAGGFVCLAVELAAGMQHGQHHFDGGLALHLGMRVRLDRNAAAIVGDGKIAFLVEFDLDPGGMAGNGLVHRVVDDLGEQMMHRLFVGAADIHARPATHGLQALQNGDVGRVITLTGSLGCGSLCLAGRAGLARGFGCSRRGSPSIAENRSLLSSIVLLPVPNQWRKPSQAKPAWRGGQALAVKFVRNLFRYCPAPCLSQSRASLEYSFAHARANAKFQRASLQYLWFDCLRELSGQAGGALRSLRVEGAPPRRPRCL